MPSSKLARNRSKPVEVDVERISYRAALPSVSSSPGAFSLVF